MRNQITLPMMTTVLGVALSFALATAALAMSTPSPVGKAGIVIHVAEGCGEGFWRGPGGHCHPFAKGRECPRGYHIGPEGKKCWPN